jgi:hypothetical protein
VIVGLVKQLTTGLARPWHFQMGIVEATIWRFPMKHTQFPPISDASVSSVSSQRRSNSVRGYFSRFVEAFHESRRLQAARVIRQHQHLIDRAHKAEAVKKAAASAPGKEVPQIVIETANTENPGTKMSFNAKLIIVIVVAGFGVLHFMAEDALRHGPATQPAEDLMPLANRD